MKLHSPATPLQILALLFLEIGNVLSSAQHADTVLVAMGISAILFAVIPLRFILVGVTICGFVTNSKVWKRLQSDRGNRRLKEWWDSIPVVPIRVVDEVENRPD